MLRLKDNMIETQGSIMSFPVNGFTEAAYVHKRNNFYYLSYASGWPESISYATSDSPIGPWTSRGLLNGRVSSETNHQSIIEFKGQWYFIYHNAGLPNGGNFRRSVCIDYLNYNPDGTIRRIVQTTTGVSRVVTALEEESYKLKHFSFDNFSSSDQVEFEIYDLVGKKIADGTGNKATVISYLTEGRSFLIRLKHQDQYFSFKVMKY